MDDHKGLKWCTFRLAHTVWRNTREYFPVIQIETEWVLLNLENGRTTAEQEVRAAQEGDPALFADPMSHKAQRVQEAILRELDAVAYQELVRDLRERRQKEPAVLSAAGVLVNGNRRCAALRELNVEYMAAVVLPDDATPKEIRALEFELQIAKDFREEYGDVNRLLMIERLMQEDGYDADGIARRLRMTKEDVQAEKGILELMREYIQVVRGAERLGNLKGKYQAFKELYWFIQDTRKDGQFDKAEKAKSARFLGILGGTGYRELRNIDDKFVDDYIAPAFEKEPDLRILVTPVEKPKPVDLGPLEALTPDTKVDTGQTVLEQLVHIAYKQPQTPGPSLGQTSAKLPIPVLERARIAIQGAAKDAAQDAKDEKYSGQPLILLSDAAAKLRRISLEKAKAAGSFSSREFLEALTELCKIASELEAKCKELGDS